MSHPVRISIVNGTPFADPDEICVCPGCEVEWVPSDGVATFDVKFQPAATPFRGHSFDKGNRKSGPCQQNPGLGQKKRFKYTLSVNGSPPIDPEVIVDGGP